MAKFCFNCGNGLEEAAKFCPGCGTQIAQPAPAPAPVPEPVPEPPQPTPLPFPVEPPPLQYIPQQPFPQQPHPPQPYPVAPLPVQKKSNKKLLVVLAIIAVVFVGGIAAIIAAAVGITGKAAKKDFYELGNDKIPSIKYVLGDVRKISNTSTSISGGTTQKEYLYNEPGRDQGEEMSDYLTYLREKEGFLLLTDVDFTQPAAWVKVGRNSVDSGYEIIVQIEYDATGYYIICIKQPGEITPIANNTPTVPANNTPDPYNPPDSTQVDPYSLTYDDQELWYGQFENEDGQTYVELFFLNDDYTFIISILYEDTPRDNYDLFGEYTLSGGRLYLTDVEDDRGLEYEDMEFRIRFSGNTMTLDGEADYWRVADEDRPDVLTDPFIPYPYTSFSAR